MGGSFHFARSRTIAVSVSIVLPMIVQALSSDALQDVNATKPFFDFSLASRLTVSGVSRPRLGE